MTTRQLLEFVKLAFPTRGETELLMRLNTALQEFADYSEICRSDATLTKAGALWITLPTDFNAINDVWLESTTGDRLSTNVTYEINRAGTSIKLMDKYDRKWIIPPATATYLIKIDYIAKPIALTLVTGVTAGKYDGEVDGKISQQYHDAICYRAMEALYMAGGDLNSAKFCRERYDSARRDAKAAARMRFSKPFHAPYPEMEI